MCVFSGKMKFEFFKVRDVTYFKIAHNCHISCNPLPMHFYSNDNLLLLKIHKILFGIESFDVSVFLNNAFWFTQSTKNWIPQCICCYNSKPGELEEMLYFTTFRLKLHNVSFSNSSLFITNVHPKSEVKCIV